MYDMQLVLASLLTAYLIFRCCWVCRKQRSPAPLYRVLGDENDDSPVEQIVVSEFTCRRPQIPNIEPPLSTMWNFDNMRPLRISGPFVGPAVHGAARGKRRGPLNSSGGPPPPYSRVANGAPIEDEPPPTYHEVVSLQRQADANRTPDT